VRITHGTFSYLPDFTDEEITKQIEYCLANDWPLSVEFTDDPHPRNTYWEMWGLPMFDLKDPAGVMHEIEECRKVFGNCYIRVSAFDPAPGWESLRLSFIVNRPPEEPGFFLDRTEAEGRRMTYTIRPYAAAARPMGERY
jgi:ribulose-bisphosphate carboxylase small chain